MTETTKAPDGVSAGVSNSTQLLERTGYDALWLWFGLSRASWLTLPRVLMHEMPDDWQARMAQLLNEWDEAWDTRALPGTRVQAVSERNRLTRFPNWLLQYRRPDGGAIDSVRSNDGGKP